MTDTFKAKWTHRIRAAQDYFEKWEKKFRCKTLDEYYEGIQTALQKTDGAYEPYVLNLFASTFAIKKPTLMFKRPIFYVDPKPANANDFPDEAYDWANNATDLLNTLATDPRTKLAESLEMAIIDSGPYFGIIEVGFNAKWIKNPNVGLPKIQDTEGEEFPEFGDNVEKEPAEVPVEEWIYTKRIPSHRFRVGGNDCASLDKANWVGYYEFLSIDDMKKAGFSRSKIKEISYAGTRSDEYQSEYNEDENQVTLQGDLIKVWRIWDIKEKKFFIITDGEAVVLFEETFERLPLFSLRFQKRRKGWFPVPYFFNWKSPQDEINETREQIRSARRRAKRLWTAKEQSIDPDELDKIMSGPDGSVVWTRTDDPLKPVQYPPLDASIGTVLQVSKDDFNIVSGTSSEQRGQSDRTTATQAAIINQRATIRDSEEREIVANWICEIGAEILKQAREHFTLPMYVKTQKDLGGFFKDLPEMEFRWKSFTAEDLGTIDYAVSISVESMSPVAQDQDKKKFMEFLAVMSQYQIVAIHPELIREAAYKLDYRNNKVIRAFQQAAAMQMVGQMSGAMPTGSPSDNMGQRTTEQMQPPTQAEIENQLAATGVPQQG